MRPGLIAVILSFAVLSPWAGGRAAAQQANTPQSVQPKMPMPWDQPPPEFTEVQRQEFHAGVQAAIHDYDGRRKPRVTRSNDYRRPPVSGKLRKDYRHGFRRGYRDAMTHLVRSHGQHT